LTPVGELNVLPEAEFARALRPLFETAPPLAAALYAARPFASYAGLLDRAETLAMRMPRAQQIEVVNAHPRIGDNAQAVSELSYREQGYALEAGQDLAQVYARLAELNLAYEQRFGFRFVVFVNGRPKAAIVDVLEQRLHGAPEAELGRALTEMLAIARDRLRSLT
jgi:2-oxo-4-hydroxy-4-carboxy-5-ureidoimidazoline decarboxylase